MTDFSRDAAARGTQGPAAGGGHLTVVQLDWEWRGRLLRSMSAVAHKINNEEVDEREVLDGGNLSFCRM